MRQQVVAYIRANYETVEGFCWDKDLNKATVSNFIHDKKDFSVSTLEKIAKAINGDLKIKIE